MGILARIITHIESNLHCIGRRWGAISQWMKWHMGRARAQHTLSDFSELTPRRGSQNFAPFNEKRYGPYYAWNCVSHGSAGAVQPSR